MKERIAIITARGGSKRIPKKNIREFRGKPIIAYSIQAALNCGLFSEVMVSTDSQEIAEIAKQYGASVPFMRSEKNSDDHASTRDVILEVIKEYQLRGRELEYVACIYPTAPFVTSEMLEEAMHIMIDREPIEVTAVIPFSFPPQRGYVVEDGCLSYKYPEYMMARSQDLEKMYHDAGLFYIYNVKEYTKADGIYSTGKIPYIIDESKAQDIDNEDDWKLAELKYQLMTMGKANDE